MPQQNYLDELTPAFTPLLAIKEASRCLLCHDAPCSQACPAQTDPGKFIRSIYFRNFKGAAETIRPLHSWVYPHGAYFRLFIRIIRLS